MTRELWYVDDFGNLCHVSDKDGYFITHGWRAGLPKEGWGYWVCPLDDEDHWDHVDLLDVIRAE